MCFSYVSQDSEGEIALLDTGCVLEVEALQAFLDDYLTKHPQVRIDYIHGEDVVRRLAAQPDTTGFLLPSWGRRTSSRRSSTGVPSPGRPSPWGRPTTSAFT